MSSLEQYFDIFRKNTIGHREPFRTPYGDKEIVYADWVASGRLYGPIERRIAETFGPFVGNTHTETSVTGTSMTRAYHLAHKKIKSHVNAGENDVIITAGFGMTAVVNKFQRILGLSVPEQLKSYICLPDELKPVVFISHMEHHSNQTSWMETLADVVALKPDRDGLVDPCQLEKALRKYKSRKLKIGSFTACSNVTGVQTPYHELAGIMHAHGGYCFVDFAASAPYVDIDMHPDDPAQKLDAIFFSPHKFLGGPGTSGVMIFDSKLYEREVPDHPGGGTVDWTNPWGQHKFVNNIEAREDGGTPGFLQSIRAALCIELKEEMSVEKILAREEELIPIAFDELLKIPGLHILADNIIDRLGIISFYIENIHFNLMVKLLNDRFGIQVRGGCSCAGTYGHYLLHIGPRRSRKITDKIDHGDLSAKPGWVRLSLHPTLTNDELTYITHAIGEIALNHETWSADYHYSSCTNEYHHIENDMSETTDVESWFRL
ncbi:MAG: aminotransferase class V-fold PLP-dependent enzyme [candidate division KSB1 bacterium]|jgi:selenocysteine lyase/cysteine desulfurase|nr:aminotransferase class V-fold PLP-dependent enzyme [candidate division KSB1 bacterium]